jgi:hypothetical protein
MLFFYWDFGLVFYFNLTFKHLLWYQKNIIILSWYLIWSLRSHSWCLLLKTYDALVFYRGLWVRISLNHILFLFFHPLFFLFRLSNFFFNFIFLHFINWSLNLMICFILFFFFVFSWSQKIINIELALNFAK